MEKFWLALTRFKSKRNNGLNAYTQWGVRGAISDMARDWRNRTAFGGMESDIQRFLRYGERWNWPAEIIKLKFPKFSIEEIEWEKEVVYAIQEGESYSEGGVDDEKAFDSDNGRQLETATDSLAAFNRSRCRNIREGPLSGLGGRRRSGTSFPGISDTRGA